MTGATPEPVVDSAPLANGGTQRIALGAVLISAAAHVVFIGGFALLEWSPDARPGSDGPTPLLVDIVADDPNALPPGRKAAAAALPMQQLASASGAGDPLASVQADEVEVPADAPQSAAESVPPETPEEAVAATGTPGPAPLALDEPALASDPSLGRTDVAAPSDIVPAGTVELDAADGPESLPADAPTEPATDTAEIDPSAATLAAAPALAETEPLAGLSPEDRPSIAAPTEPALEEPASDAPEVDPSTATSVAAAGTAETAALAGLAPEDRPIASPVEPALQAPTNDAAEVDPSTATSVAASSTADAESLAGLSPEDRPIAAPVEPALQPPAADAAKVGPSVATSAPTTAISETAPLVSLPPKDEAAVAPPAEPAVPASLSVPLAGPEAPVETAAASLASLPPVGETPRVDAAQGASISAVTDAAPPVSASAGPPPVESVQAPAGDVAPPVSASAEPPPVESVQAPAGDAAPPVSASAGSPPVESVQAPAGDAAPANVPPVDGDVPSVVGAPGPSTQAVMNPAALATVESEAAQLTSTGTIPLAIPGEAIPAEASSEPVAVAKDAPPAVDAPTQLAVLMPPKVEPRAFDPNVEIEKLLLRLNCARLDARFDEESGEVSLSGRLSSQADQRELVEQISAIAGIRRVEASALKVLGKPYCEILDLLNRPELAKSDELRHDVAKLGDASVPDVRQLPVGTPLNLSFHAPDFASYVYVVYLSSDGTVSHLLPAGFPGERLEPRQQFTIGDQGDGGSPITITPPVGVDIVLALGSSEPLFLEPRKQGEPISDYLRALGSAIDRVRQKDPSAQFEYSYHPIEVVAAPAPAQ